MICVFRIFAGSVFLPLCVLLVLKQNQGHRRVITKKLSKSQSNSVWIPLHSSERAVDQSPRAAFARKTFKTHRRAVRDQGLISLLGYIGTGISVYVWTCPITSVVGSRRASQACIAARALTVQSKVMMALNSSSLSPKKVMHPISSRRWRR